MSRAYFWFILLGVSSLASAASQKKAVDGYANLSKYQLGVSLGYTNLAVDPSNVEEEILAQGASKSTSNLPLNGKLFFRIDVGGASSKGLYVETGFEYAGKHTTEYRAPDYMMDVYAQNYFGYLGLLKHFAIDVNNRFFLAGGLVYGRIMSGYAYDMGGSGQGSSASDEIYGSGGENNTGVNFYLSTGFQFDIPSTDVGFELSGDYYTTFMGESSSEYVCGPASVPGQCSRVGPISYGGVDQFNINLGIYYKID